MHQKNEKAVVSAENFKLFGVQTDYVELHVQGTRTQVQHLADCLPNAQVTFESDLPDTAQAMTRLEEVLSKASKAMKALNEEGKVQQVVKAVGDPVKELITRLQSIPGVKVERGERDSSSLQHLQISAGTADATTEALATIQEVLGEPDTSRIVTQQPEDSRPAQSRFFRDGSPFFRKDREVREEKAEAPEMSPLERMYSESLNNPNSKYRRAGMSEEEIRQAYVSKILDTLNQIPDPRIYNDSLRFLSMHAKRHEVAGVDFSKPFESSPEKDAFAAVMNEFIDVMKKAEALGVNCK